MVSIVGPPDSSHAYSSWSARARALVSGRCTEPLERVGGLEGRLHRLGTFADPRQRLSLGLRCQHAKPDCDAMRQRDIAEPPCRFPGHILKMRCLTADHAPQCDDGIEALARGRGFGDDRQLERPGHPGDLDMAVGDAAAPQRGPGALEELRRDVFVKPADYDRHAPLAVGGARSGRCFVWHDQWVRRWPSLSRLKPSFSFASTVSWPWSCSSYALSLLRSPMPRPS